MRLPLLHARAGNAPLGPFEFDLAPRCSAQLDGPDEGQQHQFQCDDGGTITAVTFQCLREGFDLAASQGLRVLYRGTVDRTFQRRRRVAVGPQGRNAIPEDGGCPLPHHQRNGLCATLLYALHDFQQVRSRHQSNGECADVRKHVHFQKASDSGASSTASSELSSVRSIRGQPPRTCWRVWYVSPTLRPSGCARGECLASRAALLPRAGRVLPTSPARGSRPAQTGSLCPRSGSGIARASSLSGALRDTAAAISQLDGYGAGLGAADLRVSEGHWVRVSLFRYPL